MLGGRRLVGGCYGEITRCGGGGFDFFGVFCAVVSFFLGGGVAAAWGLGRIFGLF